MLWIGSPNIIAKMCRTGSRFIEGITNFFESGAYLSLTNKKLSIISLNPGISVSTKQAMDSDSDILIDFNDETSGWLTLSE